MEQQELLSQLIIGQADTWIRTLVSPYISSTRNDYLEEVLSEVKTFTQVKREMRAVLLQRPFDLDLVQLQAAIPLFKGLPGVMAKQIWIEAFLIHFEARLPCCLWFKLHYGAPLDMNAVQCIMDGCQNTELRELLQKREK